MTITTTPKAEFNLTNSPPLITRYEYDAVGNRIDVTDSDSKVTRYSSIHYEETPASPMPTTAARALRSTPGIISLAVRDALNQQHRMQTIGYGQKIREMRPGGQAWQWSYDPVGNLQTQTDAKNQLTTHTYDNANRLTRIVIGAKTITFDYNPAGSMIKLRRRDSQRHDRRRRTAAQDQRNRQLRCIQPNLSLSLCSARHQERAGVSGRHRSNLHA